MDSATKLSNNNRNMYFKILIINRLFSVVKLEFLLICKTNHKEIMGRLVFLVRLSFLWV